MLDALKSIFTDSSASEAGEPRPLDTKLAAAALMVHVIAADGKVTAEEDRRLHDILAEHYAVSPQEADELAESARRVQGEAVDIYAFTSVLKRDMSEEDRFHLIEDLWEMVYADGELHEFEDNVVWRAAELIGVQTRNRMELKQRVLARRQG